MSPCRRCWAATAWMCVRFNWQPFGWPRQTYCYFIYQPQNMHNVIYPSDRILRCCGIAHRHKDTEACIDTQQNIDIGDVLYSLQWMQKQPATEQIEKRRERETKGDWKNRFLIACASRSSHHSTSILLWFSFFSLFTRRTDLTTMNVISIWLYVHNSISSFHFFFSIFFLLSCNHRSHILCIEHKLCVFFLLSNKHGFFSLDQVDRIILVDQCYFFNSGCWFTT